MPKAKAKAKVKAAGRKEREYRLCNDMAPLSWIIKTGGKGDLLTFDEAEGRNRAIRHCRNEKSIYVEEQSEHAILDPIVIERGRLVVPATEVITQDFLDQSPDNKSNGGNVFEEVDADKEAEESLKREDLILDLKQEVRDMQKKEEGIINLQSLVAVLKGSTVTAAKFTSSELRREIFLEIDRNPERFIDENGNSELFGEDIKRRHIALLALASDTIRTSGDGRRVIWTKGGETITNIPAGVKPTDHLFEFLESDEGIIVLEEMQKRM
jgi:hypothetical protein